MNSPSDISQRTTSIIEGSLELQKVRESNLRLILEYFTHTNLVPRTDELDKYIDGTIDTPDELTYAALFVAFHGTQEFDDDTYVRKIGPSDFEEITYDEFIRIHAGSIENLIPRADDELISDNHEMYSRKIFDAMQSLGFINLKQVAGEYIERFTKHMQGFTL